MVVKDIPPFCVAQGDRAGLVGLNTIGLERAGYSSLDIQLLEKLYRKIFVAKGLYKEKLDSAISEYSDNKVAKHFLDFCKNSERGITLTRKDIQN
jgi:UDP-N-acetylglucosamine acyltransferase